MVKRRYLILTLVIAAMLVGNVIATHNLLTAPYPGHNDFITPWEAARSFWVDGVPVYSEQSNINIQTIIYGRAIEPGEFPNYYAYPFYTIFLMLPLVYAPFAWAAAIWMVTLEVCLIAALILLLRLYRWQPRPLMLAWLVIFTLFFYPAARGLILGQVSHVIYLLQVVALWAILTGRFGLAGAALALTTLKPQMSYLIVPFVLLWALRERQWRLIGVFTAIFGALLLMSFALQPTWMQDWFFEIGRYTDYTAVGSPVWVVTQHYLSLGAAGEWALSLVGYAIMLWAWLAVIVRREGDRWLWTAALTLTITHLVAPRTATTHFVVLLVPLLFYIAMLNKRGAGWLAALLLLVLLVLPWWHTVTTLSGELEHPATYLPLPFGTLALLLLTRSWWWREPVTTPPPHLETAR